MRQLKIFFCLFIVVILFLTNLISQTNIRDDVILKRIDNNSLNNEQVKHFDSIRKRKTIKNVQLYELNFNQSKLNDRSFLNFDIFGMVNTFKIIRAIINSDQSLSIVGKNSDNEL